MLILENNFGRILLGGLNQPSTREALPSKSLYEEMKR